MNPLFARLSDDKNFLIAAFVASLLVSFMFGYTVFRYWQIDVCRSEMKISTFDESIYK